MWYFTIYINVTTTVSPSKELNSSKSQCSGHDWEVDQEDTAAISALIFFFLNNSLIDDYWQI